MKTKAAVLEAINKPLSILELEIPALQEGQVLVEIHYSGVCHSQLNEIRGRKGEDRYLPHTLGHEGSGIVLEVGPGVTKVKAGDPVVLSWIKGLGLDAKGPLYRCGDRVINSGPIATFMEHAVIAENRLIPIPASMPLREAALLGCAIPTGAGVVFNQMKIQPHQSLAIFGFGGVGTSALLAAKVLQAHPIIIVDANSDKLAFAKELGATEAVHIDNLHTCPLLTSGVDFALECAGQVRAMQAAFRSVRPQGGICIVAGNPPKGELLAIDPFDLILGKQLHGTWGGASVIDEDISRYTRYYNDGTMQLNSLIAGEDVLDRINDLVVRLENGIQGRLLIKM